MAQATRRTSRRTVYETLRRKVLTLEFPPGSALSENELAAQLGVKAQMVQNSWDGLVPALQRGNFDIILNGLEITDEHRRQIAMSRRNSRWLL